MVVIVTASFSQDAVFFCGEKLKCQFRFTNPAPNSDSSGASPTRATSPERMVYEKPTTGSNDASSSLSTLLDEGNSICSSRSSSESFSRVNAYGFKPSPATKLSIEQGHYKDSTVSPQSGNKNTSFPVSRANGLSHQSSLSQPTVQPIDNNGNSIVSRHYRPSSVSSWFSPFTSSPNISELLRKNTAMLHPPPVVKEKLLWGFVQLVGHFAVDESLVHSGPFEPLKAKKMYRAANGLGYGGSLGGGTMGHNHTSYTSPNTKTSSLADIKKQGESRLFPVYSTPPSVIFCDVSLAPGDSIVYDYEITLPSNIPSSYRGKSVKFLYYLILGTQRGEITHEPNVVQLPFRLFSRFDEQGRSPEYNLSEPVLIYNDNATIKCPTDHAPKKTTSKVNLSEEEFLSRAMDSLSLQTIPIDDDETDGSEISSDSTPLEPSSCMRAVYGITRRIKPASYSFNRGDVMIGRLCLRRSYFRIGETIPILIHFLPSSIKCYQISITLESFEQVTEGYSCQTPSRTDLLTRQILAQFHTPAANADRLSISLSIPNHCTPGFTSSVVRLQHRLRLEFMVAEKTLQNVATSSIDKHRTHNRVQLPTGVEPEKLVCLAPIYLLPTHHAYAKSYRNFHSFELN